MRYNIIFHTEAGLEYVEAYKWYEQQQPGLGSRYQDEVESVLQKIAENPYTYHIASGSYREAVVDVFPFVIVYKVKRANKQFSYRQYIIPAGTPKPNTENNKA